MKIKTSILILIALILLCSSSICFAEVQNTEEDTASQTTPGNIVFAGMVVVFLSLLLVAVIIDLLKHLRKRDKAVEKGENELGVKKKIVSISPVQPRTQNVPLNQKILTTVVMTIFLHENEVENHSKMLLTMKRAKISQWQQSSKLHMPNERMGNKSVFQRTAAVKEER